MARSSQRLLGSTAVAAVTIWVSHLILKKSCSLRHEICNHSSGNEFLAGVDTYIEEVCKYGAILGPSEIYPITIAQNSPFMTRNKPNSDRHGVIIDLRWLLVASVNSGIDKNTYLDVPFTLTLPTFDNTSSELKSLDCGALVNKIDVSHMFCYLKVDPGDYNLLGLDWHWVYVNIFLPFGKHHERKFFLHLIDAVHYIMHQRSFRIIYYIHDYLGGWHSRCCSCIVCATY